MNAPMTKFAIMRANRKKQSERQIETYERMYRDISRDALYAKEISPFKPFTAGVRSSVMFANGKPMDTK